jgi:hypothetical protein
MATRNDQLCRREFLTRAAQATVAVATSAGMGAPLAPCFAGAAEVSPFRASRISYYCNGEIHVNEIGKPEGKPVTTGYWDFKPSWSKTGDMLVCFRRLKDDPDVLQWKTAIFVVNVDGTGFHQLSDGTHTDFNPTWTRDGKNSLIWNRKNPATGGFMLMQGKVGGKPGGRGGAHGRELSRLGPLVSGRRSDLRVLVAPGVGLGPVPDDPQGGWEARL